MSTSINVDTLPELPEVYVKLYKAIAKHRPSLDEHLAAVYEINARWDTVRLERYCAEGRQRIRETCAFVEQSLQRLDQERPPLPVRAFWLCQLFTCLYTHANYWYVLLDGVLFEGIFEDHGKAFLLQVAEATNTELLELLQNILDPLTEYHYVRATTERTQTARGWMDSLKQRLDQINRGELAELLERFVTYYSSVKRWQVEFKDLSGATFQRFIPPLRTALLEAAHDLEIEITDEMPWSLLDLIQEQILPAIFERHMGRGTL